MKKNYNKRNHKQKNHSQKKQNQKRQSQKNGLVLIFLVTLLVVNIVLICILFQENKEVQEASDEILEYENQKGEDDMQNPADNQSTSGVRVTLCDGFYYEPLSEELKAYITGKSYQENDRIGYTDLRHVIVQYVDFNGQSCEGELIVNVQVADDILAIFKDLYDASYPIEKIRLVDEYNADDDASMADNNTSAFNYRTIDGTDELSDHGYGIAVDINPLYNPYVRTGFGERDVLPVNAAAYADRTAEFAYKIVKDDICYQAFISRGWKWGGEWDSPVDYQHFYKEIS